jgi:hypothetical protein
LFNDIDIQKIIIPIHVYTALKLPRRIAWIVGMANPTRRNDEIIGNLISAKRQQ